jgi:hypothetical protein
VSDLETRLVELGDLLDVPAGEDLARRVATELRAYPSLSLRRSVWPPARRRLAIVIAALAALVGGAAIAPAVADWLGLRGVRVHQEAPPRRTLPPVGTDLKLGTATTLEGAGKAAGFTPVVPEAIGPPAAVWIDMTADVPIVSLVYADVLIGEFYAALPDEGILHKFTGNANVQVEPLTVAGGRALWISGAHEVAVQAGGRIALDRLRLSDSALLVEHGSITVRIETRLGREEAIRIAESLR